MTRNLLIIAHILLALFVANYAMAAPEDSDSAVPVSVDMDNGTLRISTSTHWSRP